MSRKFTWGRSGRFVVLAALGVAVAIAMPFYAFGGDKQIKKAEATLLDASGKAVGTVEFQQERDVVEIEAKFDVLPAGFHGFHVHTIGNCTGPRVHVRGRAPEPGQRPATASTPATCPSCS